jgi:hypothetical protein
VEVLIPHAFMGFPIEPITFTLLLMRLDAKGVALIPGSDVKAVEGNKVVVASAFSGRRRVIEGVDTVVVARGSKADNGLYKRLRGKVRELYAVGQCVAPRKMLDSTLDGLRVGRMV